jgi:glucose/arabinose dehydrogenase
MLNRLSALMTTVLALPAIACSQQPGRPAANSGPVRFDSIEAVYLNNCAGCHGARLNTGSGGSLVDGVWKHGSKPEEIFRSISEGIADLGMPAYGEALGAERVRELVAYIQAAERGEVSFEPAPPLRNLTTTKTFDYEVKVDVWAEGLATPWALAFLDERRALVTEKPGRLRMVIDGRLLAEPIRGVPAVQDAGQGGMMDVAIDPKFAENGWIYLGYTHGNDRGHGQTRIVRGRLAGDRWTDEQVVFQAPPDSYTGARVHFGTRIVFDAAGLLYFSIGDRGAQNQAQDLSRPNGKVHRLRPDGSIPPDNPFVGREGALPSIFSYGHRNQQGMTFHPVTGELWTVEHGPRGGDELNLVRRGLNYGWPVITYGINYDGTIITDEMARPGMEQPVWFWRPSTGVCAAEFYTGEMFPRWRNQLLVSALAYQDLRLLRIENDRVIHEEVILKGHGRVRDVQVGPDGAIYAVLNDPGSILRLSAIGRTKH